MQTNKQTNKHAHTHTYSHTHSLTHWLNWFTHSIDSLTDTHARAREIYVLELLEFTEIMIPGSAVICVQLGKTGARCGAVRLFPHQQTQFANKRGYMTALYGFDLPRRGRMRKALRNVACLCLKRTVFSLCGVLLCGGFFYEWPICVMFIFVNLYESLQCNRQPSHFYFYFFFTFPLLPTFSSYSSCCFSQLCSVSPPSFSSPVFHAQAQSTFNGSRFFLCCLACRGSVESHVLAAGFILTPYRRSSYGC